MHLFISWHSVFRRHHKGKPFKVFRASPSHNAINRALSRHGNGKAMVRVTANELKPPFKVWNVTEILASRGGAMQTRGESVMMGGWKEKKSIFSSCFFYSTMWRRATSADSLHVLQGISKKFCLVCISPPGWSSQDGQQTSCCAFSLSCLSSFYLFWFGTHCNAALRSIRWIQKNVFITVSQS